jgi:hypothetical protein
LSVRTENWSNQLMWKFRQWRLTKHDAHRIHDAICPPL